MDGLKRRRTANNKVECVTSSGHSRTPSPGDIDQLSWTNTVQQHWTFPLFCIVACAMMPYVVYVCYLFVLLQHPDLIAKATLGIVHSRPAVGLKDPRQLLIVGTMSSGTSQVADDMRTKLNLEIGHENADTKWNFVRDGTVSWFHGTRYLEWKTSDSKEGVRRRSFSELCSTFTDFMGFHPNMYRDGPCSPREKWSSCWIRECLHILHQEWGCALRNACVTPFVTTLFQTRHPVRTVESLVAKFCEGDNLSGNTHPSFLRFAGALFPHRDFLNMSCVEAAGFFVVEYSRSMLAAMQLGKIAARYKVEESTPCDIAVMAGFDNSRSMLVCNDPSPHPAKEPMRSSKFTVNRGKLNLRWEDFLGGKHGSKRRQGDPELRDLMESLCVDLDYDA
jgi:hypothetical protein